MLNFNEFIEEAKALFSDYIVLSGEQLDCKCLSKDNPKSYIAIAGNYYFNRLFEGIVYQSEFYIVVILDKTRRFVAPIVWLPKEERPYGFSHMYDDKTCCLGLIHEIISIWGTEQRAVDFFEKIVDVYLLNFLHFKQNGKCATTERPHAVQGILDYYASILKVTTEESSTMLQYVYNRVKRKEQAKGHNLCPCGSGKKLRNCHGSQINLFLNELYKSREFTDAFLQDLRGIMEIS